MPNYDRLIMERVEQLTISRLVLLACISSICPFILFYTLSMPTGGAKQVADVLTFQWSALSYPFLVNVQYVCHYFNTSSEGQDTAELGIADCYKTLASRDFIYLSKMPTYCSVLRRSFAEFSNVLLQHAAI